MTTYRVLALDGGGIRGLLTVALLRRLCQQPGLSGLLDGVDLFAGTSSGGLIALALAHRLGGPTTLDTLHHIEKVFLNGQQTFGEGIPRFLGGQWLWPRFGTRARERSFRAALGEARLGELDSRVLVTSFDLDDEGRGPDRALGQRRWRPKIFHNFEGLDSDRDRLAWKVALYTTAGPTYFPTVDGYIDGGVFSNNPSMCALAQLFDRRYKPNPSLDEVVLLSVGAGLNLRFIRGPRHRWGLLGWGTDIVRLMGDGTVGIADYQCGRLLGPARYRRLEPTFPPGLMIEIDDLDRISDLADFVQTVSIEEDVAWIREHWMPDIIRTPASASVSTAAGVNVPPRPPAPPAPPGFALLPLKGSEARDTSADGWWNKFRFIALTRGKAVWDLVQKNDFLTRVVNGFLINLAIMDVPPRPNALSMKSDRPTWDSLTDRTYYGRHLGPAQPTSLPSPEAIAPLFRRGDGEFRPSNKSTALFGYFAQWFIDGVVRTDFRDHPNNILRTTSSHDIDLSNLYGRTEETTRALREGRDGRLRSQCINCEEYPPFYFRRDERGELMVDGNGTPVPDCSAIPPPLLSEKRPLSNAQLRLLFAMGGDRINITPGYAMMNILFLREHNWVARELKQAHPRWDDETLFQVTRNVLIVELLKIVVEDYINHIAPYHFKFRLGAGRRINKAWHRPNWVSLEFNLLYRWHSLMPDHIDFVDDSVEVADCAFRNDLLLKHGLQKAFAGASRQKAGEIGLFNTPPFLVHDAELPSLKTSRTASLRSYNDYREWSGFPRATHVNQISSSPRVRQALMDVYGDVDKIDLFTGLFAEDIRPNSVLAPLMGRMVGIDAFSQALTNPLLAESVYGEAALSQRGLQIIDRTRSLNDIVARNVTNATPVSFTHSDFRRS